MAPPRIRRLLGERIADQAGESAGEALVVGGGGFDGDPVLDRHVAAAVAKQTRRGARIAHAGGRHASNRIDAVIAAKGPHSAGAAERRLPTSIT